jgi:hypothetical protein
VISKKDPPHLKVKHKILHYSRSPVTRWSYLINKFWRAPCRRTSVREIRFWSTLEKDKRGHKDLSLIDPRPEHLKACERRSALNCCLRVRRRVFRARLYRQYTAAAFLSYPLKVPIQIPDTIRQLAPSLHQKIAPGVVALLHLLERSHGD